MRSPSKSGLSLAKERSRSRWMAALVALMLAVAAPKLYAQVRLAVVDMQRAILETEQGRHAKNSLKTVFEAHQEELNAVQERLKRQKSDIEKQQRLIAPAALQKRMADYQEQVVNLQKVYLQYQQELAQREAELTKQILVNLQGVVRQIGTAEGYTAVFDQSGVVWAPTHIDLTDRVIAEYNRQFPAAATPAAAAEGDAGTRPARPARPATGAGTNPHPRGAQQ
jgi:outer membrane protein